VAAGCWPLLTKQSLWNDCEGGSCEGFSKQNVSKVKTKMQWEKGASKHSPANSNTGLDSAFACTMESFIARNAKAHDESFGNMAFPNEKGAIVTNALCRMWFAVWRGEFSPGSLVLDHHEITHLAVMRN